MNKILDYVAFRVFQYFEKRDASLAKMRAISFLAILQGSCFVPLFMVAKWIFRFDTLPFAHNDHGKYYFGLTAALILYLLNAQYFKNRFNEEGIRVLKERYQHRKDHFSIWWIFLLPVFLTFLVPIIFAIVNGTIEFPFLNTE